MRRGSELYCEFIPVHEIRTEEYWKKHINIIKNYSGSVEHLGSFSALICERCYFFQKNRDSRDGLILVIIASACWELVRALAEIKGNDIEWHRKKYAEFKDEDYEVIWEDSVRFLNGIKLIYNIHTFIRHPAKKLDEFGWVLHENWDDHIIDQIIETTSDLNTIMSLAANDFSIGSGFVGDMLEKQQLHDTALKESA